MSVVPLLSVNSTFAKADNVAVIEILYHPFGKLLMLDATRPVSSSTVPVLKLNRALENLKFKTTYRLLVLFFAKIEYDHVPVAAVTGALKKCVFVVESSVMLVAFIKPLGEVVVFAVVESLKVVH